MLSLIPWFRKNNVADPLPKAVACGNAFDQVLSELYQLDRQRIDVRCYSNWPELRLLLKILDQPRQRRTQSVLLVIDRPYQGDFATLIARTFSWRAADYYADRHDAFEPRFVG